MKLNQLSHYPDPECKEAKKEISHYFKIDYENIILGNGSTELIYLIVRNLKPKKVLIPIPTFYEYEKSLNNKNVSISFYKLIEKQEFAISIKEIISQLAGIDLVFLCNPNNPTGTFLHREEILILVKEIQRRKIFLFLDEVFIDLHEEESFIKEVKNYNYLIILRSLTKFFGLPGLRIGFGVGSSKLIKELEIQKIPWSVNYFAQIAVREVLKDEKFIRVAVRTRKENIKLLKELKLILR